MTGYGPRHYGDPCRECGFEWSATKDHAMATIAAIPARYRQTLAGVTGSEIGGGLSWSPTAYVCHVADNLRIWAERLMGVVGGAEPEVAAYDQDLLARARDYDGVSLEGAWWSLERAVGDWLDAVARSSTVGTVLVHPERGALTLEDVVVANTHDAVHHGHDLERILGR